MPGILKFGTPSILLSVVMGLVACKKHHTNPDNTPPSPTVYVLGSSGDTTEYWKNGVATVLTAGGSGSLSAFAMTVSDSDVYVAGQVVTGVSSNNLEEAHAEYWKNGVGVALPDSTGIATAGGIYVNGADVYVAGCMFYSAPSTAVYTTPTAVYPKAGWVANYWQNGVPVQLPGQLIPAGPQNSTVDVYSQYVSGIFVAGGSVYVAGGGNEYYSGVPSSYQFAQYWDQGVATNLDDNLVDSSGSDIIGLPNTTGIYVSGTDVYLAGTVGGSFPTFAVVWKNGVASILGNGTANSIFVSGSDVYVAGASLINTNYEASYWVNGQPTVLSTTPNTLARSIFVSGSDIYVAGTDIVNGVVYATYWKNGVATHLSPGAGGASAIYVQ
jgi:hypothetical protein